MARAKVDKVATAGRTFRSLGQFKLVAQVLGYMLVPGFGDFIFVVALGQPYEVIGLWNPVKKKGVIFSTPEKFFDFFYDEGNGNKWYKDYCDA